MNYNEKRDAIADRALELLKKVENDPNLYQENLEDANRILMDAGLFPHMLKKLPPEEFVDRLFRDNKKLDDATDFIPMSKLPKLEQLSDLAYLLTPPYIWEPD